MMDIIQISGKVKFPIAIDPSVWIFDDRKADLASFFSKTEESQNEQEEYTKQISKHWDREIKEGNEAPSEPVKNTFKKQELVNGTFGIRFAPFLSNAELDKTASAVQIIGEEDIVVLSLEKAGELIAAFSENGKPLKEDGPMHLYYGDGSNRDRPIKAVREIIVL
ncbi:peptidyl-prolyl cis-trans isomerase [Metabacillus sp. KIGAM252]|uniref:Peptidyl-prolyl cis-trans isomerase n=1 Tax=Metabacillus flavus TaxID=2823519 RepID=A0ABS5LDL8_9BACI|nr:peptidyl-prolyl cis-trans isomerase [Metabacillus flavus]MBS2968829.1 peptidyl-prolyl cis-trans isomerase [Metabacillus flavus]